MTIDTQVVIKYIDTQLQTFSMLSFMKSEFNDGLKEGLNIIKTFIEMYEVKEGKEMAKYFGEK